MPKGYRFTAKEELQMLSNGYVKHYVSSEEEMVKVRWEHKSKGIKSRMSHEYNKHTKQYTFLLYVKEGYGERVVKNDLTRDYNKILQESVDRVKQNVWDIVLDYGYTYFEPIISHKQLKLGNLGYVQKGTKSMVISHELLDLEDTKLIDDVVSHELFHCVNESRGHDRIWKMLTQTYNRMYDANITTYSNELISKSNLINNWELKAKCDSCGHVNLWKRNCDSYRRACNGYMNCKCGGTFNTF